MFDEHEPKPQPPEHLRPIQGNSKRIKALIPVGLTLLLAVVILTFVAPSALWFLLYPALIVAALGVLATAAAFLLRYF